MNDNAFINEDVMEQDFIINDVTPDNGVIVPSEQNGDSKESLENQSNLEDNADGDIEATPNNPFTEMSKPSDFEKVPSEQMILLNNLKERLLKLDEKFDKKIAEDTHKNSLFDKMYEELASYKKDLYAKLVGPFVNETISLLDDYERLIERIDSVDHEKLKKYVIGIPDDLESILDNNGVERYSDDTEKFNPKTQRVIKTIPTGNIELENVVVEHARKGYRWNGVMLKPEMVKIFKYKEGYVEPAELSQVDNNSKEETPSTPESEVTTTIQE